MNLTRDEMIETIRILGEYNRNVLVLARVFHDSYPER